MSPRSRRPPGQERPGPFKPYRIQVPARLIKAFRRLGVEPIRGDLMRFWSMHLTERDPFMDFGSIDVAWPLDFPLNALSRSLRGVFEAFYRISYELYRLERQTKEGKALAEE